MRQMSPDQSFAGFKFTRTEPAFSLEADQTDEMRDLSALPREHSAVLSPKDRIPDHL